MRKGRDGEMEKKWKMEKIMVKIVATTSLPVDRLSATDCNAAARANIPYTGKGEKRICNSGQNNFLQFNHFQTKTKPQLSIKYPKLALT